MINIFTTEYFPTSPFKIADHWTISNSAPLFLRESSSLPPQCLSLKPPESRRSPTHSTVASLTRTPTQNAATYTLVIYVGECNVRQAPPEKFIYSQSSANNFIHSPLGAPFEALPFRACTQPNPSPTWLSLKRSLPELPRKESPGMLVYSRTAGISFGTGTVQWWSPGVSILNATQVTT